MMDYKEKRREAIKKFFPTPVTGKGLVNSVINKLPFEMHLPGYNYLGPGTKLEKRLNRGDLPANPLDAAAQVHDIAYSKSKNLHDRHVADKILQEAAWKRVKAPDATIGEKAVAWFTTNTMRAKRAIGAGLNTRTPTYRQYSLHVSESDKTRIVSAAQNKIPVDITVNLIRTKDSLMNEISLPLTLTQIRNIVKAKREKREFIKLRLSIRQVQHFKQGGFLPALLAAAPAVAGVASALGTLYNSYQNKKANDRLIEEKIRHNRALEGKGLYMNKKPKAIGGNVLLNELLLKKKTLR